MTGFTVSTKLFREFLGLANEITDEAWLQITSDCIKVIAVDPANVALCNISIPRRSLKDVFAPVDTKIALDVSRCVKILKSVKCDEISLRRYGNKTFLYVDKRQFGITISDKLRDIPRIPDIELNCGFSCSPTQLRADMMYCSEYGDFVDFKQSHGKIRISSDTKTYSNSVITNQFHTSYKSNNWCKSEFGSAKYSLNYLCDRLKSMKGFSEIEVVFGNDMPMSVSGSRIGLYFEMLLAPRIEWD